ncbi:hypothetical protein ILFOPFJJ_05886 [Ensifer psoraleae]|nr:hypothetical protein [Sinorhizobium psoraleae]
MVQRRGRNTALFLSFLLSTAFIPAAAQMSKKATSGENFDAAVADQAKRFLEEGRETFRFDTFGSEDFWGGKLKLHEAIGGEKAGGVGTGLSPEKALELGLKVDVNAIPKEVAEALNRGEVDLKDPASTLVLLKSNAVVGVTGFFSGDGKTLRSVGIQCSLCHSTVDDAYAPGIGHRLDGWPNRDLDIGAIVALAPDLTAFTDMLQLSEDEVKAKCATCHVPPIFTEPGWNLHKAEEIGIDDFQAMRSPDERYRTAPLRALWDMEKVHKGGFYHDGRFASLRDVVDHYDRHLELKLTDQEKSDLIEYLKSI